MAELNEYLHFTGPQRRDRALHVLIGFLRGICADGTVNQAEQRELRDWVVMNERLAEKCPAFAELVNAAKKIIVSNVVTKDDREDLLSLCLRLESHSGYYGAATHAMQELHGLLHGVIADGVVVKEEADAILNWQAQYEGLRGVWPFTEIESLLVGAIFEGKINEHCQDQLLAFFGQLSELSPDSAVRKRIDLMPKELTVGGICAVDPLIEFRGRSFCFTGQSHRASRKECHVAVNARGGSFKESVSDELDYLVVCDGGNPCWAYSCYGRKVEEVVSRRRDEGLKILIVHEADFWDATN